MTSIRNYFTYKSINCSKTPCTMKFLFWITLILFCLNRLLRSNLNQYLSSILTYSMGHNPSWEITQLSASQKIPCSVWNPRVHYQVYKSLLPFSILFQDVSFPQASPSKHVWNSPFPCTCYMPRLFNPSWFDQPNCIWWVQIMRLLIMQFSPLP
jgi:hypothetical protein